MHFPFFLLWFYQHPMERATIFEMWEHKEMETVIEGIINFFENTPCDNSLSVVLTSPIPGHFQKSCAAWVWSQEFSHVQGKVVDENTIYLITQGFLKHFR